MGTHRVTRAHRVAAALAGAALVVVGVVLYRGTPAKTTLAVEPGSAVSVTTSPTTSGATHASPTAQPRIRISQGDDGGAPVTKAQLARDYTLRTVEPWVHQATRVAVKEVPYGTYYQALRASGFTTAVVPTNALPPLDMEVYVVAVTGRVTIFPTGPEDSVGIYVVNSATGHVLEAHTKKAGWPAFFDSLPDNATGPSSTTLTTIGTKVGS